MSQIPARSQLPPSELAEPLDPMEGEGPRHPVSWRAIVRSRWIILVCAVIAVAISVVLTRRDKPLYEGSSTLRFEQKQSSLPEVFRTRANENWLPTEMQELQSRALAAQVVTDLGLRLAVLEPDAPRSALLAEVQVSDSAEDATYRLIPRPGGRVALVGDANGRLLRVFAPGSRVEYGGFSFALARQALPPEGIRFAIRGTTGAALQVVGMVWADRPSRDVDLVRVTCRSADPELAWRVPQALVTHYIAQRQELQTLELRSTIDFLKNQIGTIANQLADAEQKLEVYRKRNEVIAPETQAKSQVTRLVEMQTQRNMLEDERTSIDTLVVAVDAAAAAQEPGTPSVYRRLLAFPNLMQTEAATGLLRSLGATEDERAALLTRRTPEDSDVRALNDRIHELERQIRGLATTYRQGLSSRIQTLDSSVAGFRRQLQAIPEQELQYARLERQPKVLEGVYTMLQTRLKEAEVAVAARDPSVRIIDSAIPPGGPVWPRPMRNALTALMFGLMLGVGIAFTREYFDRAVRTRMDVRGSTGLPVIGLIPRIHRKVSRVALIAEPRKVPARLMAPPPAPVSPTPPPPAPMPELGRRAYTFLGAPVPAAPDEPVKVPMASLQPTVQQTALTISPKAAVIAEALRMLETNIAFAPLDAPVRTLVFTSPLPGDGKTTAVVNLVLSIAQRGTRVLLIDADVRRGMVDSIFRVAPEPGLSEVLRGLTTFEQARRSMRVGERGVLDYLTSGKFRLEDHGLVASDAMRALLARAREEYELVMVDTPPVNVITDGAVLAANADGVILVARVGVTEQAALSYAVEQLRHVRAAVLGVVLNDIDLRRDAAYDSTYKYFRAYEYTPRDS